MTHEQTHARTHDVVVVAGHCAGAASARLLPARGHEVAVLERARGLIFRRTLMAGRGF
jgi:predicted NAD/FAD-dependent oxidoreductase